MARSKHGGAHELGQNYLHHSATLDLLVKRIAQTQGPILEIGPGRGALTQELIQLGRSLRAVDIDEHNVAYLRKSSRRSQLNTAMLLTPPSRSLSSWGTCPST